MESEWTKKKLVQKRIRFFGSVVACLSKQACVRRIKLKSNINCTLWLHLPRARGVVMTTSVLLGWWMLDSLWSGWWSCLYTHLGGRHKRARPRLPSHPITFPSHSQYHIPNITFPISHFPTTYVATHMIYQKGPENSYIAIRIISNFCE